MVRRRTWAAGLALAASLIVSAVPLHAEELARPGRVANTDGANLRLRAAPDADATILKRLGPDWRLTVLGPPSNDGRWLRVEHGGTTGYVAVGYVALQDVPTGEASRPGQVVNTNGQNLRLRATPDASASILKRLGPGWLVTVLGEPSADGQWLRVEHGGTTGYVAASYIGPPSANDGARAPAGHPPRQGWIANTDGANLRLRASPGADAAILKRLAPGWRVTILDGPFTAGDGTAWVRIEHAGATGYAAAAYVAGAVAGGGVATPAPAPAPGHLMTREAARLRTEPSVDATIITRLLAGTTVESAGRERTAEGYHWLQVRAFGREGWIAAFTLGAVPQGDTGHRLAAEALTHLGRPYVWGGETPSAGFDCSGLVLYVVQKVAGIDLTHVLARQVQAGRPVERHELQPGDLVFFRDTYKPGLSHVGFYIGNGQFVNAQSESVGVAIASLDTPYWRARYYGARRLQ